MSEMINLRLLEPEIKIALSDGATAEVVSHPMDGVCAFARYLSSPSDASLVGTEEMLCAQDIVEVLGTPLPRVHPTGLVAGSRLPEAATSGP
jgi:hypothetical protein